MRRLIIFVLCLNAAAAAAQPLTLDDCRRMALDQNRNLKNAVLQHDAAQDNLRAYQTNRLPKFLLAGDYLYSSGKSTFTLPGGNLPTFTPDGTMTGFAFMPDTEFDLKMRSVYSAGVSAGQALYLGGKVRASVRMAKIGTTLAELNAKKTQAEVLVAVDEAFFACIRVSEMVRSADKYREVLAEFHRQMENAHQSGMKSRNDLLKVQVRLNEAELQLRQAQNAQRLARMNLCYHIGLSMTTESPELTDGFEAVAGLRDNLADISARPEYAMLEQQIELKKQNVALTRSEFLPQVTAMASYNYTHGIQLNKETLFSKPSFMGGVSVNIPLFHWGEGRRKVSAARREVEVASNRFDDLTRQMQLELMQAANDYDESVMEVALTERSLAQAEENRTESGNRYGAGMETLADYLEAQALWQKAQSDLVEARSRQRISYTKYLKAAGLTKIN